jgi:hypothetical protein
MLSFEPISKPEAFSRPVEVSNADNDLGGVGAASVFEGPDDLVHIRVTGATMCRWQIWWEMRGFKGIAGERSAL